MESFFLFVYDLCVVHAVVKTIANTHNIQPILEKLHLAEYDSINNYIQVIYKIYIYTYS